MMNKRAMEKEIARLSFSMDELRLFLDTHPKDTQALEAFRALGKKRREQLERYCERFGPMDAYGAGEGGRWDWVLQPWPWEKEA